MPDKMTPEHVVKRVYESLSEMGLKQNREKWYLEDAGHRGYAVDVGTSYNEVTVRISENGITTETIRITRTEQFEDSMELVALDLARVKAKYDRTATVVPK